MIQYKLPITSVRHSDCNSKILSTVVSTFTGLYIHLWPSYFPDMRLSPPLPSFDGRVVLYPNARLLKDYLSWRQVDCKLLILLEPMESP